MQPILISDCPCCRHILPTHSPVLACVLSQTRLHPFLYPPHIPDFATSRVLTARKRPVRPPHTDPHTLLTQISKHSFFKQCAPRLDCLQDCRMLQTTASLYCATPTCLSHHPCLCHSTQCQHLPDAPSAWHYAHTAILTKFCPALVQNPLCLSQGSGHNLGRTQTDGQCKTMDSGECRNKLRAPA